MRDGVAVVWAAVFVLSCGDRPPDPHAAAMVVHAQDALRNRAYNEALAWADSALVLDGRNTDAQFIRGRMFFELGQLEKSQRAYEMVLQNEPDYPGASHNLGNAFFGQSQYRQALRAFRREASSGTRPNPFHAMGATFARLSEPDSARDAYRRAIGMDSTYIPALVGLAEHYEASGEFATALVYAKRAQALRPDHAGGHYLMGRLLARQGEYEAAVSYLEQGTRDFPWDHSILYALGQAYQETGQMEEAVPTLVAADSSRVVAQKIDRLATTVLNYPTNFEQRILYAGELHDAGRLDEAIRAYLIALALRPHNLNLQNNLGAAYMQRGDTALAVARYRRILAQDSTYVIAWLSLGWHYWRTEDRQAAVDAWAAAARHGPAHPAVLSLRSYLTAAAERRTPALGGSTN